jgi:hypothetical protein
MAPAKSPGAKAENSQGYKDTAADVHCACQDAAKGAPDPTKGSVFFNNRDSDSTAPRDMSGGKYPPVPVEQHDGPYNNPAGGQTWETFEKKPPIVQKTTPAPKAPEKKQ